MWRGLQTNKFTFEAPLETELLAKRTCRKPNTTTNQTPKKGER